MSDTSKWFLFRYPIWQAIGVIVAIVALVISTYVAYDLSTESKRTPELTIFQGLSFDPISFDDAMKGRIALQIDSKKEENVRILYASIINSGKTPILSQDFIEPLQVTIDAPWKLLAVTTNYTEPKELKANWVETAPGIYAMDKALWNAKDFIRVLVLITNPQKVDRNDDSPKLNWSARILNLPRLQVKTEGEQKLSPSGIFYIIMHHEGYSVYWLAVIAIFLFWIGLSLCIYSKRINALSFSQKLLIVSNLVLSCSSAETIVHSFRQGIFDQWWGAIPLLVLHLIVLFFFAGLILPKKHRAASIS